MLISTVFCFSNYLMNIKSSMFDGYFNFFMIAYIDHISKIESNKYYFYVWFKGAKTWWIPFVDIETIIGHYLVL